MQEQNLILHESIEELSSTVSGVKKELDKAITEANSKASDSTGKSLDNAGQKPPPPYNFAKQKKIRGHLERSTRIKNNPQHFLITRMLPLPTKLGEVLWGERRETFRGIIQQ